MRPFDYAAPASVEEAVALLAECSGIARPLAGGTDLITQLKEGRRQADLVVDLKRIPLLDRLTFDPEHGLTIGAAVSCARLQESPVIRQRFPVLAKVAGLIGSYQVQSRASLGGNLCNASPSADGVPALIVLGARAIVVGAEGERAVAVESFCTGPGRTVLRRGEFLTALHVPAPVEGFGADYERFIPRNEMDIAVAGAGAALELDGQGRVARARIALSAVAPTPLRLTAAEAELVGAHPEEAVFARAAAVAAAACSPISDLRGSADYRRHLVEVLTRRVLRSAANMACGEGKAHGGQSAS